ncbi:hypothetical protein ED92_39065 [Amycolatopsis sp. MJM2582]|uniref:hypothetical protein n=1 Tax=Amycolatopsis sp. MJM2582 TaxID=1427749 RepID=UPI000507EAEF|nr:hypothetical protein [Amycolatopsis sp. MJM2582]KFZ77092.1 hypothetical protein ED92_39065 [Amycolatopsis sp. MJM2582]
MSTTIHSQSTPHTDAYSGEFSERSVHFVGSLPPAMSKTDLQAMQWFLDHAGDTDLLTLPSDRDPRWIIDWLTNLASVPALRPRRAGDSTGYDDMPTYRLAPGRFLAPEDVSLRRVRDVTVAMATRPRLRTPGDLPPHQVSLPNALDLSYFCFGAPRPALAALPIFREALIQDVLEIHNRWDTEATFQLETPAVLTLFERTPRPLWKMLALGLAKQAAELITAAPPEINWIIHLCYGDLAHRPMFEPTDLVAAVLYLNALERRLTKAGHPMPAAHIPLCTGTSAPPTDRSFYRALGHLRGNIDMIAGLVDENHPDASLIALQLAEDELDRPIRTIAAACGLGRRTPEAAAANTRLARKLARTPILH